MTSFTSSDAQHLDELSVTVYASAPVADSTRMGTLVTSLETHAPAASLLDASTSVAWKRVKSDAEVVRALDAQRTVAHGTQPAGDEMALHRKLSSQWKALHGGLSALGLLASFGQPHAARALAIDQLLFNKGLAFTTAHHANEFGESAKLLKIIDDTPGLQAEIDALVPHGLVAALRDTQADYGKVLGITAVKSDAPDLRISEPLKALAKSVARYATALVVLGNADETAAQDVRRAVVKALRPLDELHAEHVPAARSAAAAGTPGQTPLVVT